MNQEPARRLGLRYLLMMCLFVQSCCADIHAQQFKLEKMTQTADSKISPAMNPQMNSQLSSQPNSQMNLQDNMRSKNSEQLYYVKQGDTLSTIALALTGALKNWPALARHNQLQDAAAITEGMLLQIPGYLLNTDTAATVPPYSKPTVLTGLPAVAHNTVAIQPAAAQRSTVQRATLFEPGTRKLDLFVGEVSVLRGEPITRVAVGNGKILRAEVLESGELLIIAQAEGSSSLRLWHAQGLQSDFNIRVSAKDPETRFHIEKMVKLRVKMVEFRKSALRRLGIDWGDSITGPTFASAGDLVSNSLFRPSGEGIAENLPNAVGPFASYFGIASSLGSRIHFLQSTGDAVLLAEPTLSCANGGSASFLAGGEVPYPALGANGQSTVEFKDYGIKLEVSPRLDTAGNVQTQVLTEISSIDPAVSVQGAPGLLTRRTRTQVNVVSGETIVIAGLLRSEKSRDDNDVPGLARLPVLGGLFKSRNRRDDTTELVIFITPEVLNPALPDEPSVPANRHQLIDEISTKRMSNAIDQLDFNLVD